MKFQVAIPGKRHEDIGHNEESDSVELLKMMHELKVVLVILAAKVVINSDYALFSAGISLIINDESIQAQDGHLTKMAVN